MESGRWSEREREREREEGNLWKWPMCDDEERREKKEKEPSNWIVFKEKQK